jgi:hypothetical protein
MIIRVSAQQGIGSQRANTMGKKTTPPQRISSSDSDSDPAKVIREKLSQVLEENRLRDKAMGKTAAEKLPRRRQDLTAAKMKWLLLL